MNNAKGSGMTLSQEDAAIWRTILIDDALRHGALDQVPRVPATVRMPDGRGPLASGPYQHLFYEDVQYQHVQGQAPGNFVNFVNFSDSSSITRAAGYQVGAALTGRFLRRRGEKKAAAMSGGRWSEADHGEMLVGSSAMVLRQPGSSYAVHFEVVQNAMMVAPHRVSLEIALEDGEVTERIFASPWAELVFVLWASTYFPDHAQLVGRAWITPGWYQRVQGAGLALPPGA